MSRAEAVSELALKTSFEFIINLLPEIISRLEPAGTGAFFKKNTESPLLGTRYTLAFALLPALFEIKTLRMTKVVVLPGVTTLVVALLVTSAVRRLDFVVFVKTFAMSA